jgi:hypothetical protein
MNEYKIYSSKKKYNKERIKIEYLWIEVFRGSKENSNKFIKLLFIKIWGVAIIS